MKFSANEVGHRIKAVRTEKKMTQSELCGTEITRNHLSLIESGKSLPSVGTLCYLAERLEVPIGYFFSSDRESESKYANLFAADDAKSAYIEKDYAKCIEICEKIPPALRGDELSFMLAKSHLESALLCADRLEVTSARNHLMLASDEARHSCYISSDFLPAVKYYELLIKNISTGDIPLLLTDLHEASSLVSVELILYMKMLLGDCSIRLTSTRHRQHAAAVKARRDGDHEGAFALLSELAELSSLPFYMRYHVYNDLEICADRIGEFKAAYTAAKRKLELMNI